LGQNTLYDKPLKTSGSNYHCPTFPDRYRQQEVPLQLRHSTHQAKRDRQDDYLFGDNGDDLLYGGTGNNSLEGAAGNDKLYAGDGDNILYGGLGQNTLYGGNGRDLLVLAAGDGGDTIFNFVAGTDYLGLMNGLTFEQLTITQGTNANANNTLIANQESGELLATLVGVEANTLNMWDFSVL
jgi:Ca2+-binding RTX toxin-like protein